MTEEKFPDDLTEETIKKWYTVEEISGYKFLKIKPGMFTPPKVEGPPDFLPKVTTYKKKKPIVHNLLRCQRLTVSWIVCIRQSNNDVTHTRNENSNEVPDVWNGFNTISKYKNRTQNYT